MQKLKVMTVFGTRPEAIKMAPVVQELRRWPDYIEPVVAVTAQHREMLDQVLELFRITPDYDLNIMSKGQTLYDITVRALDGLHHVMEEAKPDVVLVHGDTTTTFVGALAAYYAQTAVGHVEAGLRTHDKYSPYPEEMNRHLTGALTDYHFAPTASAKANLLKENVDPQAIYVTGNTVIDALRTTVQDNYSFPQGLNHTIANAKRLIVMTTHRRENLGEPLAEVYRGLSRVLREHPDTEIIFPVHLNPAVRKVVDQELGHNPRVHLTDPMDYEPFANLMARADIIVTDSGGIQEEAPALGKPVLVVRNVTERPEAVEAGTVRLVGTDQEKIYSEVTRLLDDPSYYSSMAEAVNPYGDGQAAHRIVTWLLQHYGYPVEAAGEFLPQK